MGSSEKKDLTKGQILLVLFIVAVLVACAGFYFFPGDKERLAQLARVGEDLKTMEAAFQAYKKANGDYPRNAETGAVPAGMENLAKFFKVPTPVGGRYDWEGPDAWKGMAAISIRKPDIGLGGLLPLDETIDDGKLHTGKFRMINNAYFWVIDEGPGKKGEE